MSMNTSSRVGQCATAFSILSLFNNPLNDAASPPVSTVYSPIMPSEGIYTLYARSLTRLSDENIISTFRQIDTVSRVEKLPAEHRLSR